MRNNKNVIPSIMTVSITIRIIKLSLVYANMLIVNVLSVTMLFGVMLRVVAPFTKKFKNVYCHCWMKETVAVEQHLKLSHFFEFFEKKNSASKCKKSQAHFLLFHVTKASKLRNFASNDSKMDRALDGVATLSITTFSIIVNKM